MIDDPDSPFFTQKLPETSLTANGINLREHDSQGLMPFKLSISNTVMVLQWA